MGTEVAIRTAQSVSRFDQREVIDTIKQTVCKGATDAQLRMFLEVCKATGLDPFLKEIWYVAEKGLIMAARDGYLRVANENPQFDGIETRVERDAKNIPVKAVCTVWRKDRNHPTVCEAYYSEYKKSSPVWTQYPSAMISKVAEVLALKRSFAINGVVTEEEIGSQEPHGSREAQQEVLSRKLAEIADRNGKPQQKTQDEMPQATVAMAPPEISQGARILTVEEFRAAGKYERLEAFGVMRKLLGEDAYYAVLGGAGVETAGEFTKLTQAQKAYTEMLAQYDFEAQSRPI